MPTPHTVPGEESVPLALRAPARHVEAFRSAARGAQRSIGQEFVRLVEKEYLDGAPELSTGPATEAARSLPAVVATKVGDLPGVAVQKKSGARVQETARKHVEVNSMALGNRCRDCLAKKGTEAWRLPCPGTMEET